MRKSYWIALIPKSTLRKYIMNGKWDQTKSQWQKSQNQGCSFAFDCNKVQNLDTSITQMNGETLNFWLAMFYCRKYQIYVNQMVNDTLPEPCGLYACYIACGLNWHLQEECAEVYTRVNSRYIRMRRGKHRLIRSCYVLSFISIL
jgi:hypothetical protein